MKSRLLVAVVFLSIVCSTICFAQTIDHERDSLVNALECAKSSIEKAEIYNGLAYILRSKESQKALNYADSALEESTKASFTKGVLQAYSNLGICLNYLGKYDEALEKLLTGVNIADSVSDDQFKAQFFNNIGNIFWRTHQLPSAYEYYKKAYRIRVEIGDTLGTAKVLGNLGNISNGFFTDTDSAFYFYNEALSLFSLLNDSANISITYTNLGNVSKSVSGPRSGLDYYYKSLAIDEKRKDLYGQSFVLSNLAITYQKMGEYDSALYFSRRLLDVSNRINSLHRQRQAYQRMAYLFRDKKVMDSAFHYLEKYQILKDSLLDQSTKDKIAELQFEYRDKAQAQEIEILQREKEIDQLALEANYQQKLMLIILVIVLVLGIILLIARAKERSRLMKELKERQSEVEKAKELIEKKNRQLINLNESLESNVLERTQELNSAYQNLLVTKERLDHFIYKSAHDLKGPISSIRGLIYLIKLELKKIDTGDSFVDYVQKVEHTAVEMDALLMRLTESHTMNHGIVRNEEIDLAEIIGELEFIFKEKLKQLNVEFLVHLFASKSVQSDAIIIQLILKYFLENAIQFVDERRKDSFIEIRTAIQDGIFSIHIIDNGLGIEPALKPDLFKMFSKGKKGKSGLGLFYVGLLAEKISANAYLDDKDSEYTHFVLELPLSI